MDIHNTFHGQTLAEWQPGQTLTSFLIYLRRTRLSIIIGHKSNYNATVQCSCLGITDIMRRVVTGTQHIFDCHPLWPRVSFLTWGIEYIVQSTDMRFITIVTCTKAKGFSYNNDDTGDYTKGILN